MLALDVLAPLPPPISGIAADEERSPWTDRVAQLRAGRR
jgi:hypothetical protein